MGRMNFEKELKELHLEMIEMGNCSTNAIKKAIKAFKTNDAALCQSIIENDKEVNAMEKRIESRCLWLIAREQPVASDLRLITTALKMITDMERICDHAVDIAEITLRIKTKNCFADSSHILQMSETAVDMVKQAIVAYVKNDLVLAKEIEKQDDIVDDYFNLIKKELVEIFKTQPENMDNAIDFLLIAKYLERVADHAVNICEWITFSQTGEHKNTLIF